MVKRVLMIAFHYPPAFGSSGVQRSLNFSRYLPQHGWETAVLTVPAHAHPRTDSGQLAAIPEGCLVQRAFALDAARHLSLFGRYPRALARPDRWGSWYPFAVRAAARLIRSWKPDLLWSTFPIATTHRIALQVQRESGLPWIADLRDSMTEEQYPENAKLRARYRAIEAQLVERAQRVVFTTPGTRAMYAARYPQVPAQRWQVIPNGYDEQDFQSLPEAPPQPDNALLLLHSGILYPEERDPRPLLAAIARLHESGVLQPGAFRLRLRSSGHDAAIGALIADAGVGEYVELAPGLPYAQALAEMCAADGLLILQGASCNHQVPAKLYEYLRAGRPIIGLTDARGDTAGVLRDCGLDAIAPLDNAAAIADLLQRFVRAAADMTANQVLLTAAPEQVARYTREAQTAALATLCEQLIKAQGGDG